MPETLVLLHGFSGTRRAWDGVCEHLDRESYRPLALDLPGHGRMAEGGRPITFEACASHVLASAPERFTLCGYSLGGRVALHVALAAPGRVRRLLLVSCSADIPALASAICWLTLASALRRAASSSRTAKSEAEVAGSPALRSPFRIASPLIPKHNVKDAPTNTMSEMDIYFNPA